MVLKAGSIPAGGAMRKFRRRGWKIMSDETLDVVSLFQLCRKSDIAWQYRGTLEEWVNDPEIPTPKPTIRINGEYHWEMTDEVVDQFKYLIAVDEWLEAEKRHRALESVGIRADVMVEILIEEAQNVERLNSRCYTRNRGNSIQDGRRRIIEIQAQRAFVLQLLRHMEIEMPVSKVRLLNEVIRKAKGHVNVQ